MDVKQLITDIFTFNISAYKLRLFKLNAFIKRLILSSQSKYSNGNNYQSIPIIINNRNRLTHLKTLINWLQVAGYTNIIILDNKSNYEPLLEFYKTTSCKVIYLNENYGHLAFWKSGVYKDYYKDFYVYTDPDVVPVENCPKDFLKYFLLKLKHYSNIEKIGFSLKIDDLPDYYIKKNDVISWEKKFWEIEVEKNIYNAPLDTTFALYKPYTNGFIWVQNAYRTGGNYVARHLPWYENSNDMTEEDLFYLNNIKQGASHWIKKD